jgi:hypothetical protein
MIQLFDQRQAMPWLQKVKPAALRKMYPLITVKMQPFHAELFCRNNLKWGQSNFETYLSYRKN